MVLPDTHRCIGLPLSTSFESFFKIHSDCSRTFFEWLQASCETLVVGQTKKYVQQGCSEWVEKLYYKKLEVVNLDNPNPALQPPILSNWRPTVVTAFSRNHLKHGLLLLRSVGKAASDPIVTKKYKVCLVVWTMEEFNKAESKYVDCVIRELQELGMEAEVRRFPFENYPTWMRLNASLIQFHEGGKGQQADLVIIYPQPRELFQFPVVPEMKTGTLSIGLVLSWQFLSAFDNPNS